MNRLRRYLALPAEERRIFATALALVWAIRLGLWLLPFPKLQRILAAISRPHSTSRRALTPEQIAWAVQAAGRYVPGSTCLVEALAGLVLCERAGHAARVGIGVARDEPPRLAAHAWLESHGRVLVGQFGSEGYTRLLTLGVDRS